MSKRRENSHPSSVFLKARHRQVVDLTASDSAPVLMPVLAEMIGNTLAWTLTVCAKRWLSVVIVRSYSERKPGMDAWL